MKRPLKNKIQTLKKNITLLALMVMVNFPLIKKFAFIIFLFCCVTHHSVFAQNKKSSQPNILIFIADDAGMDFGCYGNNGIKTPNIDKLAKSGLKFSNAFLTSSQCSPTRTSILSGKFAHTVGTEDLHTPLDSTIKILPYYLKQQGYYTGIMLKSHIGKYAMGQFNWYDNGMSDYMKGKWNDKVLHNFQGFLDAAKDKPFFMWCAFIDPHKPYRDSINSAPKVHHPEDVTVPPYLVDSKKTREELSDYYDEIHRLDKHIGIMLDELERRGLSENTLVVFFSDNGFPFPRGKATVYDSGIQTPLIMKWDDHIDPGSLYNGLTSMIDLSPTLLEVAGTEAPDDMYGKSFLPVFYDKTVTGREFIFAERNWHDSKAYMRCIRTGKFKLIFNEFTQLPFPITGDYWKSGAWSDLIERNKNSALHPLQKQIFEFPRYKFELYDIEEDPFETSNLVHDPDYAGVLKELYSELLKWQFSTNDLFPKDKTMRDDIVDRKTGFLFNLKITPPDATKPGVRK